MLSPCYLQLFVHFKGCYKLYARHVYTRGAPHVRVWLEICNATQVCVAVSHVSGEALNEIAGNYK